MLRAASLPFLAAAAGFASAQFATARAPALEMLPKTAVVLSGTVRGVELLPVGRRISIEGVRLDEAGAPLARWVRVRLRNEDPALVETGDRVRVRALIRAPSPPAYPGAWDLQRDAFFSGLGGSGFALGRSSGWSKCRRAGSAPGSSGSGARSTRASRPPCRDRPGPCRRP